MSQHFLDASLCTQTVSWIFFKQLNTNNWIVRTHVTTSVHTNNDLREWWSFCSFQTWQYCVSASQGSRRPSFWSVRTFSSCSVYQCRTEGIRQSFRMSKYQGPTSRQGRSDHAQLESQEPSNQGYRRMRKLVGCLQWLLRGRNLWDRHIHSSPLGCFQVSSHGRWYSFCANDPKPSPPG